jgi:hypothetical protein
MVELFERRGEIGKGRHCQTDSAGLRSRHHSRETRRYRPTTTMLLSGRVNQPKLHRIDPGLPPLKLPGSIRHLLTKPLLARFNLPRSIHFPPFTNAIRLPGTRRTAANLDLSESRGDSAVHARAARFLISKYLANSRMSCAVTLIWLRQNTIRSKIRPGSVRVTFLLLGSFGDSLSDDDRNPFPPQFLIQESPLDLLLLRMIRRDLFPGRHPVRFLVQ